MLSKREKIFTLVTNLLTFALCLAVVIPFGKTGVSQGELLFKVLIAPILACVLFLLNSYVKYVVNASDNKYLSYSVYVSLFGYCISLLAYTAILMVRTGTGVIYGIAPWIILTASLIIGCVVLAVLSVSIHRFVLLLSTKENLYFDVVLFILLIVFTAIIKSVLYKHINVELEANPLQFILAPALIVLAIESFLGYSMFNFLKYNEKYVYVSREELIEKWKAGRDEVYRQAQLDILYNLYKFSKNELGIEEIVVEEESTDEEVLAIEEAPAEEAPAEEALAEEAPAEEAPVEEAPAEEAPVEEAPVEEVPVEEAPAEEAPVEEAPAEEAPAEEALVEEAPVEEAPAEEAPVEEAPAEEAPVEEVSDEHKEKLSEIEDKITELMKAKEELAIVEEEQVEVIEAPKPVYPPKEFKPSFAEMVKYAQSFDGVTYQGNAEGTNYKFFVGKKVFLILNDTPKDYRLTFLMDLPQASGYAQILAFAKAKSPKSIYSFKLVSKGEFGEEEIFGIIKGAYEMVATIQERELAAKEAEKARKAQEKLEQKLAAMTEEQRVKYLERLAKKEAEAKMTPEEKAQMEADKLAAKEAAEAEKAAAKARAEEEKAAAKAKAEAEKAAAKAKAEEEKAKEKARLEAEKAKEKAKLEAQKQKEKEKLAAQKAKEKEKAKLEAEKAKEKAKLEAQKQKEKEKLAAQKAKEKEKAKLEAEKAKEKAKLEAQKQKEKEKLAAQKAKEKEAAKAETQKAKESATEEQAA